MLPPLKASKGCPTRTPFDRLAYPSLQWFETNGVPFLFFISLASVYYQSTFCVKCSERSLPMYVPKFLQLSTTTNLSTDHE